MELQVKKSEDYESKNSSIVHADYYPRGLNTLVDVMWTKILRIRSLLESNTKDSDQNFESLEDSAKDLINYSSFFVAWSRGKLDGQESKVKKSKTVSSGIDTSLEEVKKESWEKFPALWADTENL